MSDTRLLMPYVCLRPVVLLCDGCITVVKHSYLVRIDDSPRTRLNYARDHASREYGWSCDEHGDFCRACVNARTERVSDNSD